MHASKCNFSLTEASIIFHLLEKCSITTEISYRKKTKIHFSSEYSWSDRKWLISHDCQNGNCILNIWSVLIDILSPKHLLSVMYGRSKTETDVPMSWTLLRRHILQDRKRTRCFPNIPSYICRLGKGNDATYERKMRSTQKFLPVQGAYSGKDSLALAYGYE